MKMFSIKELASHNTLLINAKGQRFIKNYQVGRITQIPENCLVSLEDEISGEKVFYSFEEGNFSQGIKEWAKSLPLIEI